MMHKICVYCINLVFNYLKADNFRYTECKSRELSGRVANELIHWRCSPLQCEPNGAISQVFQQYILSPSIKCVCSAIQCCNVRITPCPG